MSGEGYRDGAAQWRAIKDRSTASGGSARASALRRQLVHSRFLARLFHDAESPWVLKGGLRGADAGRRRAHDEGRRPPARGRRPRERPRGAPRCGQPRPRRPLPLRRAGPESRLGAAQPDVEGHRITVEAFCGTATADRFPVDLVTGSLMTGTPDAVVPTVLDVPGLNPPLVRLYPVIDHVADKLCAIQARYGHGAEQPSSRVRDLVDLVVFAVSVDVDGAALTTAVHGEWSHRRLDSNPRFEPPESWQRSYPPVARDVPRCAGHTDFATARELVARFIGAPLERRADGLRWSAAAREWTSASPGS